MIQAVLFIFIVSRILSPIKLNKDSDKISFDVSKLKNNLRFLDGEWGKQREDSSQRKED